MHRTTRIRVTGLALLASVGTPQAHHSGSMYAPTPIWVAGTVVEFQDSNPHTLTMLEERSADGRVRLWGLEGPGRSQIDRRRADIVVPKAGDRLSFCGFPYRSVEELSRMFPEADFSRRSHVRDDDSTSPRYLAGHVLVMEDGTRRLWEPHGLLSACILSSNDPRESWVAFIDSDPQAREGWCMQRGYEIVQSDAALRNLVEEIDGLIDDPCD